MSEYTGLSPTGHAPTLVEKRFARFAQEAAFPLESGASVGPVTLAYETYGSLAPDGGNAVLVGGDDRPWQGNRYRQVFRDLLQCAGRVHGLHRPRLRQSGHRKALGP